jgi:hypothetical protein
MWGVTDDGFVVVFDPLGNIERKSRIPFWDMLTKKQQTAEKEKFFKMIKQKALRRGVEVMDNREKGLSPEVERRLKEQL